MNSLAAQTAAALAAVFAVAAACLMFAMPGDNAGAAGLPLEAALAIVGASLVAAWCALQPLLRRIGRLTRSVASFDDGVFSPPLRSTGADPAGDEIARLEAGLARVSQHIGTQASSLAGSARQRRELLANLSHDLRTPLASMQGYLELLLLRQRDLEPAEAHNYLQTAVRQSERVARLVGDLFELTRLESDDAQANQEAFAAAELAQDVAEKFAADARRRAVTLSTRCGGAGESGGATLVQADIALIERVLDNLVDNALRHTPPGGAVTIEIDRADGRASMAVSDTGDGIAADALAGLFDRYDRATRVGAAGQAGLGLAIARRIVGLHGSQLEVRSAPGQGTRVSFDLALAALPAARSERC